VRGRIALGVPWVGRLAPIVQKGHIFFIVVVMSGGLLILLELSSIFRELRGSRPPPVG
jgi:hypothetical protein